MPRKHRPSEIQGRCPAAGRDNIEVGAKGSISKQANNGVVYARYKKLDAVIKISDGKKNMDLIRAREKYDDYSTMGVVPGGK